MRHAALRNGLGRVCSPPVARLEVLQLEREGVSQEGGSEPGEVLIGTPGQQVRYVYTGRRSERSPYIAERAQSMHGLTRGDMLQMYHQDRRGTCVPHQEKDLRYDITQRYLRKEGAGQVTKEGALHTGPTITLRDRSETENLRPAFSSLGEFSDL